LGLLRRGSQSVHSGAWWRTGNTTRKLKQEALTAYAKKCFPHGDSQPAGVGPRQVCAVSVLGDFKDPAGQSPEQPGVTAELTRL